MSSKTVLTLEGELYQSFPIDANLGRGKAAPKRGWGGGGELFIRVYIHSLI